VKDTLQLSAVFVLICFRAYVGSKLCVTLQALKETWYFAAGGDCNGTALPVRDTAVITLAFALAEVDSARPVSAQKSQARAIKNNGTDNVRLIDSICRIPFAFPTVRLLTAYWSGNVAISKAVFSFLGIFPNYSGACARAF
jgi:hypothetical protein